MNSTDNIFITSTSETTVFFADKSLDDKTAGTCDLFILIEKSAVQLALKERRSGMILAFEILPAGGKKLNDWKQLLENTSAHSKLLRNYEFLKVTAGITSSEYTLVPESLFRPGDENVYFRKNFSLSTEKIVRAQHVPTFHLYTIFGIESDLEKEINHLFQDPRVLHFSHALLSGLTINMKADSGKRLWLNVRKNKMDIVVTENKKLLLMNSYSWETNEDILYYSLFVCEQLELNPDKLPVNVTGEIETGSILYQLLNKYIRNIIIPENSASLPPALASGDISYHHYAMLYNLSLCE